MNAFLKSFALQPLLYNCIPSKYQTVRHFPRVTSMFLDFLISQHWNQQIFFFLDDLSKSSKWPKLLTYEQEFPWNHFVQKDLHLDSTAALSWPWSGVQTRLLCEGRCFLSSLLADLWQSLDDFEAIFPSRWKILSDIWKRICQCQAIVYPSTRFTGSNSSGRLDSSSALSLVCFVFYHSLFVTNDSD